VKASRGRSHAWEIAVVHRQVASIRSVDLSGAADDAGGDAQDR
jgi:hypothetical protein